MRAYFYALLALLAFEESVFSEPLALPTGREAWSCETDPVIFPGWWAKAQGGAAPEGPSYDAWRSAGPSVVKVGKGDAAKYWMYYLADQPDDTSPIPFIGRTRVLRAEASVAEPTKFFPKNVALEFWGPFAPDEDADGKVYSREYFRSSPYYGAVLPSLDDKGMPKKAASGEFEPWFMYFHTAGSALSVAISRDGGESFKVPDRPGVNPLFPFEVSRDPADPSKTRRGPIEAESKVYDQSAAGSGSVIRAPDGKYILYYTARLWNNYTLDDLAASPEQVGHPDGAIPDYGIAYAESTDGIHFKRRTALSLRLTSSASRGVGRIVEPRFQREPNGELEYVVSRPMVFRDGTDTSSGLPLYRMVVSSHSKTYRVRTLHSTDLINWEWDPSPAEGLFGFGKPASFDDSSTSYASCLREDLGGRQEYRCWYTGNRYGHYTAGKTGIGYCSSEVPSSVAGPAK
ncbi:hypothetical protein [Neorhizobium galegae]|uniref:Uncharacterized protein n=1 Tax=Neorhizobium galegae bv. officinalis TaxID=323656 RepID=A0A0T7GUG6_NEOGA|nr:hypothetical protein [Neorhizobium galegae]CDZ50934.1 Hypothetical protein NGAL_HAMBI1189_37070 [Neorhizobium galegae bv. officinalis]